VKGAPKLSKKGVPWWNTPQSRAGRGEGERRRETTVQTAVWSNMPRISETRFCSSDDTTTRSAIKHGTEEIIGVPSEECQ